MAGEARQAAGALSSGSASFLATGTTSEEPTVEGTRNRSHRLIISPLCGTTWHKYERGNGYQDIGCASDAYRTDDPSAKAAATSNDSDSQSEARNRITFGHKAGTAKTIQGIARDQIRAGFR